MPDNVHMKVNSKTKESWYINRQKQFVRTIYGGCSFNVAVITKHDKIWKKAQFIKLFVTEFCYVFVFAKFSFYSILRVI